ncbi:hypothetical protein ACOMHN_008924 [Nucella lapillus]
MAIEEDTPVDEEAEAAEHSLLEEYHQKLVVDGEVYPDPNTLKTGWEGELAALDKWPNMYITDVSDYLKKNSSRE